MRIYEWNIGMAATIPSNNGYNLKSWVIEEIIKDQPDIIVLTEFVVSRGIDYYFEVLEKNNYHWFISSSTKQNGILIALKESTFKFDDTFNYKTDSINNSEILKCNLPPDFYELQVEYSGRKLSIIGVRIRKELSENKSDYLGLQFEALDTYLSRLNHDVICIGDFNVYWGQIWNTTENITLPKTAKDYRLCTPTYTSRYPEGYSYVMPRDGKKVQLDHLVTNLKNKYSKVEIKAEYDWSFMNTLRYKNGIQAESKKKISGLPDHAILKVKIEFRRD
jgi:endonuclease/exonuclease/phosphatase family protein